MRRRLAAAVVLAAAACSGGGDDEDASGTTGTTAENVSGMPRCEELFGEGVTLRAGAFDIACVTEEAPGGTYYGASVEECTDGRTLYWSRVGWGYVGEPWHTDRTEPPAEEQRACTG